MPVQAVSISRQRSLRNPRLDQKESTVHTTARGEKGRGKVGISCDVKHHVSQRSKDGRPGGPCDWTPGLQFRIWRPHSGRNIVASKDLAQDLPWWENALAVGIDQNHRSGFGTSVRSCS